VEERYLAVTEKVSKDKAESEKHYEEQRKEREEDEIEPTGIEERHQQFLDKMEQICNAFEDIRQFCEFEQLMPKAQEIDDEEDEDLAEVETSSIANEEYLTDDG